MKKLTGAILLFGASDNHPDIRYITQFSAPDPVVYLQYGNTKHLLVSTLEFERAKRVVKGVFVHSLQDFPLRRVRPETRRVLWTQGREYDPPRARPPEAENTRFRSKPTVRGSICALLREVGVRQVTVPWDFPISITRNLEKAGVCVMVTKGILFPERLVKTPAEVARIRQCQEAAVKAMKSAVGLIAASHPDSKGYLRQGRGILCAEIVRLAINRELLNHDCIGEGTIVACGRQAADPHEQGSGPLREGEAIVIDIFPRSLNHGYWGDLSRTVVKGKPSAALKKMYGAVKAAQSAALAKIKHGVGIATVHSAAADALKRRGFQTGMIDGKAQGFIHSTGHGVGVAIHEAPKISLGPGRLRRGNVITIEPGLYYQDTGGVRIEDLVVVTRKGWRYLAVCEKKLEL